MNRNRVNVTAIEGLIRVNFLFSTATFLSIIITILLKNPSSFDIAEKLLIGLVISFKSFFFAWLLAECLKLTAVKRYSDTRDMIVRGGIMLTAFFSGAGFYTLMSSLEEVTGATKVGILSMNCGESSAGAVGCMGGVVYMALTLYFITLCNVVFRGKGDDPE